MAKLFKNSNLAIDKQCEFNKIKEVSKSATNYNAVLDLIDGALKNRGWKRKDLATALGRSRGWVSQIMSRNPKTKIDLSLKTLLDIARVLGIHPASLIPYEIKNDESSQIGFEDYVKKLIRETVSEYNKKEEG